MTTSTESIKQMVTCPIHLGHFNEPIVLKCQHAFCRMCILKCVKAAKLNDCPLCRKSIDYSLDELTNLSVSLIHKQLVENYKNERVLSKKISSTKRTIKLKISLLGSSGSGKSSLMRYLAGFPYSDDLTSTVGVDTVIVDVNNDDYLAKVYLWDTAGQEIFRTIVKSYYRNSKGIILVFDVTDERSFQDIESWLNEIRVNCYDEDLVTALVANKIDIPEKRVITSDRAQDLANRYNLLYFETSAKNGENVSETLERLVSKIVSIMDFSSITPVITTSTSTVNLNNNNNKRASTSKSSCSC